MIELINVTASSGPFRLANVNIRIESGEYAVLMGKTGCGKTTLLETICGLRTVESGTILLGGRDVTHLLPAQRLVGYVPQDLGLFSTMTVREHLEFAPRLHRRPQLWIEEKVKQIALLLNIAPLLDRGVRKLSGGEAQRVALGRALSFEPPCLLLDEPLSALDEPTREELYKLLKKVRQETNVTTLHITHSRQEANILATIALELHNGKVGEKNLSLS